MCYGFHYIYKHKSFIIYYHYITQSFNIKHSVPQSQTISDKSPAEYSFNSSQIKRILIITFLRLSFSTLSFGQLLEQLRYVISLALRVPRMPVCRLH